MHLRQLTLLVRNKKKKKERIPTFSPWIMIIMKVIISGIKKTPQVKLIPMTTSLSKPSQAGKKHRISNFVGNQSQLFIGHL